MVPSLDVVRLLDGILQLLGDDRGDSMDVFVPVGEVDSRRGRFDQSGPEKN